MDPRKKVAISPPNQPAENATKEQFVHDRSWRKFIEFSRNLQENNFAKEKKIPQIHACYFVCLGYKNAFNASAFEAILKDIKTRKYSYTIFLSPKDKETLKEWENNNPTIYEREKNNIIIISAWRTKEAWKKASDKFDKYWNSLRIEAENETDLIKRENAKKKLAEFNAKFNKSVELWKKHHQDKTEEEISQHIIEGAKDILSLAIEKKTDNKNNKEDPLLIFPLIYPNDLSPLNAHVIKSLEEFGYLQSIAHVNPIIKTRPSIHQADQLQQDSLSITNKATVSPDAGYIQLLNTLILDLHEKTKHSEEDNKSAAQFAVHMLNHAYALEKQRERELAESAAKQVKKITNTSSLIMEAVSESQGLFELIKRNSPMSVETKGAGKSTPRQAQNDSKQRLSGSRTTLFANPDVSSAVDTKAYSPVFSVKK